MAPGMKYRRHQGKHYHGWIHPKFCPPDDLLEVPEKAGEIPGAHLVLDCQGRQIFRIPLEFQNTPKSCFTYYFKNRSISRSLRYCYAFRSLKISEKLRSHDFGTFKVLAAIKKTGEWLNRHSLVVALEIESVREIASSGTHIYRVHDPADFSPELAFHLAKELARLHARGFFHGDLKTRHILVHDDPIPHFSFVDLEKCHHLPHLPGIFKEILAARDLIQLLTSIPTVFSFSDNLIRYFMECYLKAAGHPLHPPNRIIKMVTLYSREGSLSQGQTLLSNLLQLVK